MRVIVAGGRDFNDRRTLDAAMQQCGFEITEVVSGGAPGGDRLGEQWAQDHGIPVRRFQADWKTHGNAAGPKRNEEMAQYGEALVALPGGKGTDDMIRRARQHGLPVFIVEQRKANDERYQDFLHGVGEFFGDRNKRSDTSGDPTTKGRRPDPCDHFHQGKPGEPCTRILADGKPCGFSVAEHYGMRTPSR